ncbi:Lipopolysaccharide assembly protein B [Borrelia miyamotoi]|uniref:Tetratricopeptide repeat protein n=1 Tax=Borrelia miyamotoi TaxID=47466 RepID=A0AAP8YWL6_9SPIR|nr:tetratricopeptide repeat protein [Borrelia miyamotoi]AHH05154.1 Tetratricopeptide repeat family protein [Borrelia miyamotoi FR64b]ATQ14940.1 tetratricopeptide repeat protein [Borrelia miyamotoi]ATQ16123.1 tetratricopeptide repeat protein [Borrelia miyamotoi]ATQ17268.1 tetratricopeptide repeat protein [Borrelia miyamotoi]ATQ18226.1 tetratricopeptide repeat protein [Borrelia miyamotoi]
MLPLFIILSSIAISTLIFLLFRITITNTKTEKKGENKKISTRTKKLIEKAANILKVNPNEINALQTLNDYYYSNKEHENGIKYAKKLCQLIEENPTNQEIDFFKAFLSYGVYNLDRNFNLEALKFIKKAYLIKKDNIDANYYLGIAFLKNAQYKEALHYLIKIYKLNKNNSDALKYIGIALFHTGNYNKAVGIFNSIRKYIQNDVNVLLVYAQSLSQLNQDQLALEIAKKIKNRDGMAYESLLIEAEINSKNNNLAKLEDNVREIIKIKPDLPPQISIKLFSKLGELYIESENYKKATEAFTQVERIDPNYPKIGEKLEFSKRLSENLALRIYLKSSQEKFESLANEIILILYQNKFQIRYTKINEINSQFIDINFQLSNNQWEENLIVRFVRTEQKNFGELFLKDLIAKTKESKLKGLCIAPATFSDKAKQIIEGRLIDIIEGKKLMQILKKLDISKYI